jgi:hypothetical protein
MRQVFPPAYTAWLIDLTEVRGPRFVVLRSSEDGAVDALAQYLVDASIVPEASDAQALLEAAMTSPVAVVR